MRVGREEEGVWPSFGVESLWSGGGHSARHPVLPLDQLVRLLLVTIFFLGGRGVCAARELTLLSVELSHGHGSM